jgi:hypothetical protein
MQLLTFTIPITAVFLAGSLGAQWNVKTPGIPRTSDGKPDMRAPVPRTSDGKPDLTGYWRNDTSGDAALSKALDNLKAQPWAEAIARQRKENLESDDPQIACLPGGITGASGVGKIAQTPNLLLMLFSGTLYRDIYLDGRSLPKNPNPDWMGYSVGHWDGDTLIVETAGFNDKTWLDEDGHPHSEALQVTERIRRLDFGHLEVIRTFIDPLALKESWTDPIRLELYADADPIEYVCNENEQDRKHLVGKASDDRSVPIAPEVLARYAGSYEMEFQTGQFVTVTFKVEDDRLLLSGLGSTVPLVTLSNTDFSGGGITIRFVTSDAGRVTHANVQTVEAEFKAVRK